MLLKRFPHLVPEEYKTTDAGYELTQMLGLAQDVRQAFARGELSVTLSTRKLIDFFEQREQGFSLREALDLCLGNWLDNDDNQLVKVMLDRLQIQVED